MLLNWIRKYGILIAFCSLSVAVSGQQPAIRIQLDHVELEEVLSRLETEYGFLFTYKAADIQGVTVSIQANNLSIGPFLDQLLKNRGFTWEIVDEKYILLSRLDGVNPHEPAGNEDPLPLFYGSVIDSLTRKPLPFANVYFKRSGKGAYTSESGTFTFRNAWTPGDTIIVSYVEYRDHMVPAQNLINNPGQAIPMQYQDFEDGFIVVTDYLTDGIDLGGNGQYTLIRPGRSGNLPGQVEPDVLHTIQFLPGISSPQGDAGSFNIRGGAADQNLLLWEDIPIYHSAHYFGMISAFNPFIIDKVKVFRGGFGPEYGGRISGVVDMRSPDHGSSESTFGAGMNMLYGYTQGQLSLSPQKVSLVYSLRRSFSELWRSPAFENITRRNQQGILQGNFDFSNLPPGIGITDQFDFTDTHLKFSARLSPENEVNAAFFYGQNHFDDFITDAKKPQEQTDKLKMNNHGLSTSFTHTWKPGLVSRLTGVSTSYTYDYLYDINWINDNGRDKSGVKRNEVDERQLHFSNEYTSLAGHTFKLGYHYTSYDVAYLIRQENDETILADERDHFNAGLHALYAGFSTTAENRIGLDIGIRSSYYEKTGKNYLVPRARLWYNLSPSVSLNASAGKYNQFISQLVEFRGDNAGIQTPIWVLAGSREVPVLNAVLYQTGLIFNKNSWVIDLQAYTREIKGLTSLATGFDPTPREGYDLGTSTVNGLDVLVKKRWKSYRTWVSYSLSKVDYHFPTFFDPDFAAPFDQRHVFKWANLLTLHDFELSLGWEIATGKPYSLLDNFEILTNPMGREEVRLLYQAYNAHRLSLQHHLDVSVQYHFESKKNGKFKGVLGSALYNIYGQQNTYNRDYFVGFIPGQAPRIDLVDKASLGFTPNAVVRFEW